jgi:hypothetical protein
MQSISKEDKSQEPKKKEALARNKRKKQKKAKLSAALRAQQEKQKRYDFFLIKNKEKSFFKWFGTAR